MSDTYNPEEAAPLVGMAASTIRLWCKTYAVALSDGANPPFGTERRLTAQDVATLQQIKAWRDDRIAPNDIVTLLQRAASRNEPAPIVVPPAPASPQNAQEARGNDLQAMRVLSSIEARLEAVERHQHTLLRAATLWGVLLGATGALALAGFYLWVLWLTY